MGPDCPRNDILSGMWGGRKESPLLELVRTKEINYQIHTVDI